MFKKLITTTATVATLAVVTLPLLPAHAIGIGTKAYVWNTACAIYNNAGQPVGVLPRNYYPIMGGVRARDGRFFLKLRALNKRYGRYEIVGIPISCVKRTPRGQVIEY